MRPKIICLLSEQDACCEKSVTLQYLTDNFLNWNRYFQTYLEEDKIVYSTWMYEFVTYDGSHRISVHHDKTTDLYNYVGHGYMWENTYQRLLSFNCENLCIAHAIDAVLSLERIVSKLNDSEVEELSRIRKNLVNVIDWNTSIDLLL